MLGFTLIAAVAGAQPPFDTAKAIAAVKRLRVHDIDPTITAHITLETWLRRLSATGAKLTWEVNDCVEASGTPADADRDLPICVEGHAPVSGRREIVVRVAVGTNRAGIAGAPTLAYAYGVDRGGSLRNATNLSELAAFVTSGRRRD